MAKITIILSTIVLLSLILPNHLSICEEELTTILQARGTQVAKSENEESEADGEVSDDYEITDELRELIFKPTVEKMGFNILVFTDEELKILMKPIFKSSKFDPKKFTKKLDILKLDKYGTINFDSSEDPESEDWEFSDSLRDFVKPLFEKSQIDISKVSDQDLKDIFKPIFRSSRFNPVEFAKNIESMEALAKVIKLTTDVKVADESEELYQKGNAIIEKVHGDKAVGYAIIKQAADKGHKLARVKIAWSHLLGHYSSLDIKFAKEEFLHLAEKGCPDANMGLAYMHSVGIGFKVSQPKALVHYSAAAYGGNSLAQMALGYRYMYGINVASDCEKALEFYSKVAKEVADKVTFSGGSVVHRIRLLEEIEHPTGPEIDLVEYYQLLADKGDVSSQVGLGQLFYQGGRATVQDPQRALDYFMQAANAGNAIGFAFLGKMYLDGNDFVVSDNETAFKYFKKAAELGNPIGQSGLGIMYLHGYGVTKDTTKAINYFTLAADQGWVDGHLQLGLMYFYGNGVPRDYKLALKYFSMASQANHILANYHFALMHSKGLGLIRSCPAALEFFKNVAERGKWSSILMNAFRDYKNSQPNEAFMQYSLLSEIGIEVAQSNAAYLLDRSEVTLFEDRNEDLIRAFNYWKRSAAQGYSAAQVKLGDYYYYGHGISTDFDTAAFLYRKAADNHYNAQAMFNLGYMHEQGLGMKKDWHLAKRQYDLAAETNSDAKIPVALALLKLQCMMKIEAIRESPFRFLLQLDENIAANWDLYLITLLTLLLGIIMYTRRPNQNPDNEPQREEQVASEATPEAANEATPQSDNPQPEPAHHPADVPQ